MKLKIVSNPGSNDFPGLKPLPMTGEVVEFSEDIAEKLKAMGLAVEVPAEKVATEAKAVDLKAVPAKSKSDKQ